MTTPIPAGWKPIESAPKNQLVMVYTPPQPSDWPDTVRISFDYIDPEVADDYWYNHGEHYEHYCCVAKPENCTGPQERAPYTHWMPLPAAPDSPASVAPGDAQDEKPYCYALETRGRHADMNDVLLDVEYNRTDNFSGGRTGGIPLYRRSASAAAEALQFLADTEGAIESLTLGGETRYRVWWPAVGEIQGDWFKSPEAAIAAAAQVPQQGEA